MTRMRVWVSAVVVTAAAGAIGFGIRHSAEPRTAVAEKGRLRVVVAATGKVEADRETAIASKVSGRIASIRVREGDSVKGGDVLVTLDPSELSARRDEAAAVFREAADNRGRYRTLFERRSVSKAELDAVEAAYDRSKSALDRAQAELNESVLRAPFGGLISRKLKEVGEVVNALGAPETVLILSDIEPLKVRAEVDESDVGKLVLGQDAVVTSDAYRGRTFQGRVTKLASEVGRKTVRSDDPRDPVDVKILETQITLEPTRDLRLGMTVEVTIDASPSGESVIIPRAAVRLLDGGTTVEVMDRGKTVRREIRTGAHDAEHVAVLSGLAPGERVVLP